MINDRDVIDEGFKPLKRTGTEPKVMPSMKPHLNRAMSFNAKTGEVAPEGSEQAMWEHQNFSKFEKSRGKLMERKNSFVVTSDTRSRAGSTADIVGSPTRRRAASFLNDPKSSAPDSDRDMIVVVDPFSTGAHLADAVYTSGFKCARVFSIWDSPVAALIQKGIDVEFTATVQHNDGNNDQEAAIQETVAQLKALPYNILAVVAGAETGVELADSLSHRMGLRSNGEEGSLARRNKHLMGEKVRDAGVRAVKQANVTNVEDLRVFCDNLKGLPFKCVVKPVQSAGSDDVFLCESREEAETAFKRIYGQRNGLGLINESALVQEFLAGKEYVVDKVSVDGEHKLCAIWEYDKRPANGANFVYFGAALRPCDNARAQEMIQYADSVLDALGIMHGPSHMEIMYCSDGPCLVEVGSRCQGGEGTWLPIAKECIGYTQVEMTLDCYLGGQGIFSKVEKDNYPMLKHGRDTDMVNYSGGIIRSIPGESRIRALESFRTISWEVKPGDYAPQTVDCFTRPGCVQFVNVDESKVNADFEALHEMEKMGLFDYQVICPEPPIIGAVVVVDAFSSGANMAAMLSEWGYRLVLVFSEKDSPIKNLISKGTNLVPTLIIQHDDQLANQAKAVQDTIDEIVKCGSAVLAIIPGAETGVELADKLSAKHRTRTNGSEKSALRRDKFQMQEAVRDAGLRAIKQKLCMSEQEVIDFTNTLPEPLMCVVKPNDSAGSDSVFKCTTTQQAVNAFNLIHRHSNGLGALNNGALCQEFLKGEEYVLDGVSRDGQYKITAIWKYDKRSVNDANFVYYGMKLCDGNGALEKEMMAYGEKVCAAVGIFQGPSHMEIMNCSDGPCLVEVGSRCHGGEGTWLPVAKECIGYTQVEATLNCYLRPELYDEIPKYPTLKKFGAEAFLVSLESVCTKAGKHLVEIPGVDDICELASFRRLEMLTQPGKLLVPTIDCFTRPGSVQLVNINPGLLQNDYDRIRDLETGGLFSFGED